MAHPWRGQFDSDALSLFWRAVGVIWFIRVRWVHLGASWASSGSFWFIHARPRCRRVHSGSIAARTVGG